MARRFDPGLPVPRKHQEKREDTSATDTLWLRVSAFLSTRTPNTQDTYLGVLKEWCAFLRAEPGSAKAAQAILSATDEKAISYRNWLSERPGERPRAAGDSSMRRTTPLRQKKMGLENTLSNATIAKKFAVLRRLYRMLVACDLGIRSNPFDSDRVPPPPKDSGRKRPTEMIEFALVKKIIAEPDTRNPKGIRDKALLSALFGGALRRSEAAALRLGDVRKSSRGTVFLYLRSTKAKRDAEQALPKWAAGAIEALLRHRQSEGAGSGDYLFVGYTGRGGNVPTAEPISTSGIYRLFKHYCELAGAGQFVTPHSARATAITRLLDAGIAHREVQEFSRHRSIQMVELYDKRRIGVDDNPAKMLDFE